VPQRCLAEAVDLRRKVGEKKMMGSGSRLPGCDADWAVVVIAGPAMMVETAKDRNPEKYKKNGDGSYRFSRRGRKLLFYSLGFCSKIVKKEGNSVLVDSIR
jgi:hypothetical protein